MKLLIDKSFGKAFKNYQIEKFFTQLPIVLMKLNSSLNYRI